MLDEIGYVLHQHGGLLRLATIIIRFSSSSGCASNARSHGLPIIFLTFIRPVGNAVSE